MQVLPGTEIIILLLEFWLGVRIRVRVRVRVQRTN